VQPLLLARHPARRHRPAAHLSHANKTRDSAMMEELEEFPRFQLFH
jgi:hypothetical protein